MNENNLIRETPLCSAFGQCGGCCYQDISYSQELELKQNEFVQRMSEELNLEGRFINKIVPSPQAYHYRHRLDLGLRRTRENGIVIGFVNSHTKRLMEIETCPIARPEVSNFIPRLKEEAKAVLPREYRMANLTVKTGDDGRVLWGGIGRRSRLLEEKDYLSVEVEGKKIFYSLDNFFQANHYILPALFEVLKSGLEFSENSVFFDLYGGVGLFSLVLAPLFKKMVLIEESASSIELAHYNIRNLAYKHFEIIEASVENCLAEQLEKYKGSECVAMVDPPRKGLLENAKKALCASKELKQLVYLSCNPESLTQDLKYFLQENWKIQQITPLDFFPRTKHLEVLTFLTPKPFS